MNIDWIDTKEYPFAHKYFEVNGAKMHYIDEGIGEILLFVHGTPSWSFEFRNAIKILSKNFRCIAADHIGFGLSDCLLYTSPSPRDRTRSRMPSSA